MNEKLSGSKIVELQIKARVYPSGSVSIDGIRHGPSTNIARFMRELVKDKMKAEKVEEASVQEYKGYYICDFGYYWRVKNDPSDSYAIHYGSFESVEGAQKYIDKIVKERRE